ncbi:N-acetylglucosamine-6-phosphate deacetylase [Fervidobacterium thailandense]|uniref:N-acetylglucosamine-6-phosphate deacetylase n=1 Tax=Fervidobacterium thailandense TaxID=1008305 RepID=A0A1E3G126_9BACT|nr:N-acetylglucosamine-6-phosphate deacetylase [Fervidobacterium thailandense]ODN29946.1 N-acetylglucosamine-6-phosphate deacetylase [Fervidobacterium thailandense]
MILEDVLIVDPVDGEYVGTVEFDEVIHRVVETNKSNYKGILMPGFVDPHIHGIRGIDTMRATKEEFEMFQEYEALEGVWYFLPTTVTARLEAIPHAELPEGMKFHIEGPFISPKRKGAHNESYLLPPSDKLFEVIPVGKIAMVTVAPELEGFDEFAKSCLEKGIIVSLGHSDATFSQARHAYEMGFKRITHFPNAISPLHHRELGLVGAGLYFDFMVEVIPDGIHASPEFIELLFRIKGSDRIQIVTDSISATGLVDGKYYLGDLEVFVEDGKAKLKDGTIAGSTLRYSEAIRNFAKFTKCSLRDLAKVSSYNACLELGLKGGRVAEGYPAKLVLVDPELKLVKTFNF